MFRGYFRRGFSSKTSWFYRTNQSSSASGGFIHGERQVSCKVFRTLLGTCDSAINSLVFAGRKKKKLALFSELKEQICIHSFLGSVAFPPPHQSKYSKYFCSVNKCSNVHAFRAEYPACTGLEPEGCVKHATIAVLIPNTVGNTTSICWI